MSLYNIGMFILAKASWIMKPLYTISLFLDGVIYSVVSYVYKIFMLMSQIKFSRIFDMMEPLIDRVKAVIIKENRNVVPHVYICNVKTGFISKMFPVTSSNIRNGGTKLKNELKNVGGLFSDKEIDMAHAKLLILVMKNIISSVEDESMSYSDILSYYKDYITSALDKRYDEKDSEYCPSVIVEKKDNGSIIIGVRNTDFDNIYEKLVAESEVMNERTFKKQGKVLGDLSPDAGRGRGDHILGEKYSPRYGMSPNERMQRFSYTADEANELWKQEAKFREKHPELVSYVHQEKEVQS